MRNARQFNRHDRLSAGHALQLLLSLVGSALLIGLAARTGQYPYVACVGLVPLFVAIRVCRHFGAFLSGAVWGLSLFADSIADLGREIPQSTASLSLIVAAPACYTLFGPLLTRWIGFSPFVLAVAWIALELSVAPVGLAHGLVSLVTSENYAATCLAHAAGYAFVSFAAILINSIIVDFIELTVLSVSRLRRFVREALQIVLGQPDSTSIHTMSAWGPMLPRPPPSDRATTLLAIESLQSAQANLC